MDLQEAKMTLSSTIYTAIFDRSTTRIHEGLVEELRSLRHGYSRRQLSVDSFKSASAHRAKNEIHDRTKSARPCKMKYGNIESEEPIGFMETGGNSEPREGRKTATARVSFGFAKMKGPRKHQIEDFHVARIQEVDNREIGLFAVMDGHAGPHVAVYLTDNLFEVITTHADFWKDPKKAIIEAYHETDERILGMGDTDMNLRVGSTATTALLLDNGKRLIVANVGDSRAVLSRGGQAVDLSVDHEPQKPYERQMVESKGGIVSRSVASGIYRVDHRLAMSRAFGDYDLKEHLSVQPDIWDEQLAAADEFFIIASDGVWHVMSSQEVVNLVQSTPGTAEEVAKAVVSAALQRHSRDDIACLIVFL